MAAVIALLVVLPISASAAGCSGVSDWSDLSTDFTNGGTVTLCSDITAPSGDSLTVGSGSATETTAVTLDLNGYTLTINVSSATDASSADVAAVDVPLGATLTIEDSAGGGQLNATGSYAAAGIGGDSEYSGETEGSGTIIVDSGTVTAEGGTASPGIGAGSGPDGGGNAGALIVNGGIVNATGGGSSAGVGGGDGNGTGGAGGSVTVDGGTLNASGSPAIGGGSALISGPAGNGTDVQIGSGGEVTATGGATFGTGSDGTAGAFGSLSNAGTLTITSGSALTVPAGVTVDNSGTIDLSGSLNGDGTVDNTGAIIVESGGSVSGNGDGNGTSSLLVEPNNYALSFDDNGGSGTTPSTMYVYAATVTASGQSLPGGPTPPAGGTFTGWWTATSGGTAVTGSSNLTSLAGASGPASLTLDAQYLVPPTVTTNPQSQSEQAGGDVSFTAAASGIPNPTVQWQSCAPGADCATGSSAWTNVSGATSTTLSVNDVSAAQSGTEYRAVFTNSSSTATTAAATLTVTAIPQTITFTPLAATATVGTSAPLAATGGASGQPVTFSVDSSTSPADACRVTQSGSGAGTVQYEHAGTCVIDANQAASTNGNDAAADTVTQTVTVNAIVTNVALSTPASDVYGQASTVTATVTEADHSSPSGTVQFQLDGRNLGSPVTVGSDGTATSPNINADLVPGAHAVTADFTPTDPSVDTSGTASASETVSQASTTTALTITTQTLTATVSAVAPGSGTPTGTVTFSVDGASVGSAQLSGGVATLDATVPTGKTQQVAATYGGDTDFTGSSASSARSDPTITAHLSSADHKTRYGWYRSPVTVTFTCTTAGSPLTASCPSAVTLSRSAAGQSVTRTITATNGGAATATVSGIDIDRVKPTVTITGVRSGASYPGAAPAVHCTARDTLSGVASCKLTRSATSSSHGLDITTVRYTATATDQAGNTATTSVTYHTFGIYVEGARYEHGAFQVKPGRTYTIVVIGTGTRPRYIDAGPASVTPSGLDKWFYATGRQRWALGVTIYPGLTAHYHSWNLGVRIGRVLHEIRVEHD